MTKDIIIAALVGLNVFFALVWIGARKMIADLEHKNAVLSKRMDGVALPTVASGVVVMGDGPPAQ